jgi:hypothetical protein
MPKYVSNKSLKLILVYVCLLRTLCMLVYRPYDIQIFIFFGVMAYVTELIIPHQVGRSLWITVCMGGGVVAYFRHHRRIFTWGDWGRPRKPSIGITSLEADILKRGFLNMWWGHYITAIGYRYVPLHNKTLITVPVDGPAISSLSVICLHFHENYLFRKASGNLYFVLSFSWCRDWTVIMRSGASSRA